MLAVVGCEQHLVRLPWSKGMCPIDHAKPKGRQNEYGCGDHGALNHTLN